MIRTNIEQLRRSYRRRTLRAGTIGAMYIPPKGWLFLRVARDASWTKGPLSVPGCIVEYVVKGLHGAPRPIPTLDKSRLLLPPLKTFETWLGKWVIPLEHRPLEAGDTFERHCFDFGGGVYWDEYRTRIIEPFHPTFCGNYSTIEFIDDEISAALGIPLIPEDEKDAPDPPRRRSARTLSGPGVVTLHVPLDSAEGKPVDAELVEGALRSALGKAKVGTWEGHGFDLAGRRFDTTFRGANARKLLAALGKAINAFKPALPEGWHATIRYGADGDEERVEL